jgi:protein TonB
VYPAELKAAGIEGEVVAQFVVNADGTVDPGTFKVLRATDSRFVAAVKNLLSTMKFDPAVVDGRSVRQLQQMPFTFSLK